MTSIISGGELAYGIQLPIQSHSKLFVAEWEQTAGPDDLVAIAQACDAAGFLYVAVCDHVAIPDTLAPRMGTFWADTMTTLGMLAGVTTRTRLLSHVFVLAYRHPLVSAKAFATLDWLSGGRAIVGVGAGHAEGEFDALGLSFADRGRLLDDALDVVTRALTDEFPVISTPTWSLAGAVGVAPRPVQQPHPPIWIGGSSHPALRRAAEKGDGWLPQGTPKAQMPEQIAYLLAHREAVGRADDPIDIGAISEFFYVGEPGWDVGPHCTSGSAEAIAASLLELKAMGVHHAQVRFAARSRGELTDQIARFGAEVAPLL